jgi:hypothetical protein
MDVAAMAAESDPALNRFFRRRWADPPPQTRKCQPRARLASSGDQAINREAHTTDPAASAQRAVCVAAVRVGRLRHKAGVLRGIGQYDAAMRMAALADAIIATVLA